MSKEEKLEDLYCVLLQLLEVTGNHTVSVRDKVRIIEDIAKGALEKNYAD